MRNFAFSGLVPKEHTSWEGVRKGPMLNSIRRPRQGRNGVCADLIGTGLGYKERRAGT